METIEEDVYTLRLVQRQAKGDVALTLSGDIYASIFTISGTSLYGVLKEAVLYGELIRSFGGHSHLSERAFKYHKTSAQTRRSEKFEVWADRAHKIALLIALVVVIALGALIVRIAWVGR